MRVRFFLLAASACAVLVCCGCSKSTEANSLPTRRLAEREVANLQVSQLRWVDDLPRPLLQFEAVFWDARDTEHLVPLLRMQRPSAEQTVLEIGTGTGLIALRCLANGFGSAVATDINPAAVANARQNADRFGVSDRMEVRQVTHSDPGAFAVINPEERFDLIISNPPWVDRAPQSIEEYALYDERFELLTSILDGLPQHLEPNGKAWLIYGCVDAIETLHREAAVRGMVSVQLDDRDLQSLPEEFLPGMIIEVRP